MRPASRAMRMQRPTPPANREKLQKAIQVIDEINSKVRLCLKQCFWCDLLLKAHQSELDT